MNTNKSSFNAGVRLLMVMEYLGMTQAEMAKLVGGYQSKISTWAKMEKFSKSILGKLRPLEVKGINVGYFIHETSPMLKKDAKVVDKDETIQILQEENTTLKIKLKNLAQALKECKEGADKTPPGQEKQ